MPIIKEERLHKYDATEFRFDKVKAEVEVGMKDDWKRDKIDDAKKRAITTTASYDEFKSRVAGCMLKPIHRNEFNAPPKFAFNRQIDDERGKKSGYATAVPAEILQRAAKSSSSGCSAIRNARELDRELRKRGRAEDKAALVVEQLGTPEDVQRIFGRELDAEVFRQLLQALEEAGRAAVPPGTARRLLIDVATRCPSSASQVAAFFTSKERDLVARLLARDEAEADDPEIVRICASLGVTTASVATAAVEVKNNAVSSPVADASAVHADAAVPGSTENQICDGMD